MMRYWFNHFFCVLGTNIQEYCTTLLLDQLPDGTPSKNESYYLLSDVLPIDYEIRQTLHAKRLEKVLGRHQFERTDQTFTRGCLYCRDIVTPTRADFLEHLYVKHFLQLGKPQNLVFIDELLDFVERKMNELICLFCEKVFKDRSTLKEHMRKKGHKRINPDNKSYDKYFLVNYRSTNRSPKPEKPSESSKESVFETHAVDVDGESDSDWSDWEGDKQELICLFCSKSDTDFERLKTHLLDEHTFNFNETINQFNFYQKIKIINYIRRQMHTKHCVTCNQKFTTSDDLQTHLKDAQHIGIGDKSSWDQPEFFFSTYEDDGVLCHLEDSQTHDDDGTGSEDSAIIFSEDQNLTVNAEAESLSMENFKIF